MSRFCINAARVAAVAIVALVMPRHAAQAQEARITCGSTSNAQQTCRTNNYITAARLERDLSGNRCRQGSTWGFNNTSIWTNSGCQADFIVTYGNGGVVPGSGVAGTTRTIRCGDLHGALVQCSTGGGASSVRVVRQQIMGTCREGTSWGFTDAYVWTSKMCIADFEVTYNGQPTVYSNGNVPGGVIQNGTMGTRVITCGAGTANANGGYGVDNGNSNGNGNGNGNGNRGYGNGNGRGNTFSCDAGGRIESVRLVRSDNARRCRQGNSWGFTRRQIWTKAGCRGDFEVTYAGQYRNQ